MAATIVTTKINQIIESGVTLDEITEALGNAWYGDETYFEVRNNTAYYAVQRMAAEAASKQAVEAAPAAPTATPAPTACTRTRPAATAPQAATARQIASCHPWVEPRSASPPVIIGRMECSITTRRTRTYCEQEQTMSIVGFTKGAGPWRVSPEVRWESWQGRVVRWHRRRH